MSVLRPARVDDVPLLRAIERAAGEAFRAVGMAAVADDEPLSVDVLRGYVDGARAWVATDEMDRPVAYLIVDVVDGAGHVEQVSVHPDHAGRRLGSALIEEAASWAWRNGFTALTLTTFAEVAWNAPYYRRLGFRVLAPDQLGDELRRVRVHEAELGLDRWPRVAMSRPVVEPHEKNLAHRDNATAPGSVEGA
ncbi:GNAT family N-acetyltransferase [Nocardioides sp. Root151]|uniref:GNAT family N-acetyltransferase n=1 Tax=Nocardioides sp. Root151 TaxID=1736475 RepID=UPI001F3E29B6|nr:GNAT family N-acetyltransferase [Nocardioides sp. Root151]